MEDPNLIILAKVLVVLNNTNSEAPKYLFTTSDKPCMITVLENGKEAMLTDGDIAFLTSSKEKSLQVNA